MIWVSWRQVRSTALVLAVVSAALAAYLLLAGMNARDAFRTSGIVHCLGAAQSAQNTPCLTAAVDFSRMINTTRAGGGGAFILYLNLIPALLGAFLGAPLLTREFEQGTHRMAWTQSVTRRRWMTSRLAATGAAVVATELVLSLAITFARAPIDRLNGRFTPDSFNFEGIAPLGYAVLAFILGVTAGAVIRRTVPAIAVTLAAFLSIKLSIQAWLRPYYLPQRMITFAELPPTNAPDGSRGDWILNAGAHSITYQPAARFWTFQLIELTIYLALAAALLALTVQLVQRRV